jgi:hypothetical protein
MANDIQTDDQNIETARAGGQSGAPLVDALSHLADPK